MEFILITIALVLIVFMAACWVLSDANREWKEKNEAATKEIVSLYQRNYCLEAESKALRCNTNGNQEIICYTCADNGTCREGCRFIVGAKECLKQRRQEE